MEACENDTTDGNFGIVKNKGWKNKKIKEYSEKTRRIDNETGEKITKKR